MLVAVNYNSPDETIEYVKSLSTLGNHEKLQIVIVENSKPEYRNNRFEQRLKSIVSDLLFTETNQNRNYFGSVNYALKSLSLSPGNYDYFIISNVDILINDKTFFNNLFTIVDEKIGIIAPSVYSLAQLVDQNPYLTSRFRKSYFYYYRMVRHHIVFTHFHEVLVNLVRRKVKHAVMQAPVPKPGYIYAPHGAFIIFLKNYFEKGAGIDFGTNLFGEEIFVAEECRKIGLLVKYEPALEVLHAEHVSTGVMESDHVRAKKLESVKYFLKHF